MNHIRPKQSVWGKFVRWVGQHTKISLGLAIACTVVAAGLVGGALLWPGGEQSAAAPAVAQKTQTPAALTKYYSPLTGLEVPDEATTKRQVTAIMIENSPFARPQSGIKPAGVVFEAIAEGGITRFLTCLLYTSDAADE